MKRKLLVGLTCGTIIIGTTLGVALPLSLCNKPKDRDFTKGVPLTDLKVDDNISDFYIKWNFNDEYIWDRQTERFNKQFVIEPKSGYFGFSYEIDADGDNSFCYWNDSAHDFIICAYMNDGSDQFDFLHGNFPGDTCVRQIPSDNYIVGTVNWNDLKNQTGKSLYNFCKHQLVYSVDPS